MMSVRAMALFLLGAFLSILGPAVSQNQNPACPVYPGEDCITPVAGGDNGVDFLPMFPLTQTKFVYALQMEEGSTPGQSAARLAFWLEYDRAEISAWNDQETYMAVLMNQNITGTPGPASSTSCDAVWGSECSRALESYLKRTVMAKGDRILASLPDVLSIIQDDFDLAFEEGQDPPIPELSSCPWGVLNKAIPVTALGNGHRAGLGRLAIEDGPGNTEIIPSGNVSYPWAIDRFQNVTYEDQLERVAVMLIMSIPLKGDLYKRPNNLRFTMACAKAQPDYPFPDLGGAGGPDEDPEQGGPGGPSGPPGPSDSGTSRGLRPFGLLLAIFVAAVYISSN